MIGFNRRLRAAADEEALPKMGEILRELFAAGLSPDSRTYAAMLTARAKSGDVRGALDLLQQLLEEGIPPDVVLINIVLSACARAGDVNTATFVYAYMVRDVLRGVLWSGATCLTAGSSPESSCQPALTAVSSFRTPSADVRGQARRDDLSEALRVLLNIRNDAGAQRVKLSLRGA